MSPRSGCPSKTSVARTPLSRQKAATRRTTSPRRSSSPRGPPHEPSRLLPSIRYGTDPRLQLEQPAQEALADLFAIQEQLVQLPRVEVDALAEAADVHVDAGEVLLRHVVPAF